VKQEVKLQSERQEVNETEFHRQEKRHTGEPGGGRDTQPRGRG
jgi:hypothetical protein